ncbi:hypothetical protein [Deminuibacter soli]|uniref:Uncharacterized protein n=1 Tax=Deminuibacter soli TaxID=2291815 RepID=A0A3E1ND61_9BACT|nr:hypothetical protein [Deminuibacter soli]RFM25926.1 hypothetical protein DXN05_22685 [Deminuibacter soli]
MKKWMIGCLIVAAAGTGLIYWFIPASLQVGESLYVKCTFNGVRRTMQNNSWERWWPGAVKSKPYELDGFTFQPDSTSNNALSIRISDAGSAHASTMLLIPYQIDTTIITWGSIVYTGGSPFSKLKAYFHARELKQSLHAAMLAMQRFMGKNENVYGIPVWETKIQDTALAAIKTYYDHYPGTADIYQLVASIEQYVAASGAHTINPPMLNVNQEKGSNQYEAMVAIPTGKLLPGNGTVVPKKMIHSPIAVTEVKGGEATVRWAFAQLQQYVQDTHRMQPVIPYAVLLTDRSRETDTSKWVTRICFPIF